MSGLTSRNKGKAGEREVAKIFRDNGFSCRRSQQFSGQNGDADVVGVDGLHIEVKRVERLDLDKAFEQSRTEANEGEIPIVVHRRNKKPWKVTIGLEDFIKLWKERT